ncbi:MAG: Type IV pilus assembly protein PilM [Candidatus Collierbacteria bacterium GW2011_GWB1_44_6]|uniref:Type IV pilus assembly protein PilM n=2 Tax=Candidatus Collieribacteriota TaxID=1752725 RepID=A0A0G1MMW6_9BACT|nr:MAG: Type IV pilus assembly protein PilM [Candidatus Collierbacteria bacterium GW2011_GWC2_43_12]KKT73359.1 MAG: Type IV pilus assembly protein PilM [Candidatus Collierbacteria bacterium GW2011_GWB1_44_6]KKT83335.1 MAG: Type IV pilus assembly protein PilM [Microgenomates group bacterium GW2011_GWC1_44_9]
MPSYFGLDIGSTSIKLIQSDGARVKYVGIAQNPFGKSISAMTNAEKISLTDSLKLLLKEIGIREKKVVASIPESSVFSRVLKFPVMSSPELSTAIRWELDQSVPFPPSEVETSWAVLEKPEKFDGDEKISVYVVAVPSNISENYIQILELIGLEPVRLENEIPSLSRAFSSNLSDSSPSVLIDWGASGTNVVVAGKTKLYSNFYVPVGGSAMTKLIADTFGLPMDQAENYKRTYGFSKEQLDGKMVTVLKPIIDNVIGEVKKLIISYRDERGGNVVSKLVLTGGGSYLLGLVPYLSESLGLEVVIGDPFSGMAVDAKYKNLGPVFSVAVGLSM